MPRKKVTTMMKRSYDMYMQKKIDNGSNTPESKVKLGKAVKFYKLAADPEGCHETKVDHVVSQLEKGI